MPVLLDGTSVIVRLDAISERYPGFWPRFVGELPNRTLCCDGELACVGFMDSRDAAVFVASLVGRGLIAERDGKAVDCAIVERDAGPTIPCPWLERSVVEFQGGPIPVCRLVAGASSRIAVPDGWCHDARLLLIPTSEAAERMVYLRSEGMVDVYRDRVTGEVLYTGRTSNKGRGLLGRLRFRLLNAFERFVGSRGRQRRELSKAASEEARLKLEQAAESCRRQAEHCLAQAQYELGAMYTEGRGLPCDHAEAAKWYRLAAEQGYAQAQFVLGLVYGKGQGVPQDDMQAMTWFGRAADQGNAFAEGMLGHIFYWGRNGMPQDHAAAAVWFRRAAERGDPLAQHSLATQYRLGQGVTQNDETAASWFRRAANQGHASAQFDLALLHVEGKGMPQDRIQAYMWFGLAAQNSPPGKDRQDALACQKRLGRGMKPSQVAEAKKRMLEWRSKLEASAGGEGSADGNARS